MNDHERQILADLLDDIGTAAGQAAGRLRTVAAPKREVKPSPESNPVPDWLTTKALARWLHLSEQTFRKWRWSALSPA